jgi:hypothetical protein
MQIAVHFLIALAASVVGAISGIGGGIIIKPVLDTFGFFGIATINFLSGCTVLSMAAVSLIRNRSSEAAINRKVGGLLAISGVAGGIIGKYLFNLLLNSASNIDRVQIIQASILLLLTVGVLIFTLFKHRIKPLHLENFIFCIITGLILGITGAFLGIGGGPINLLVLYLFFSMDSKTAAINSLFIIFFSQLSSLLLTVSTGSIPEFNLSILSFMIIGGISGALIGSTISRKLSPNGVDRLFMIVLTIIIFVCVKNIFFI